MPVSCIFTPNLFVLIIKTDTLPFKQLKIDFSTSFSSFSCQVFLEHKQMQSPDGATFIFLPDFKDHYSSESVVGKQPPLFLTIAFPC